MTKIKTFNKISKIINEFLPAESYDISDAHESYEAVLVRSAALHEVEFPKELLAIARAGAGVNNIPLDKCSEQGIVVFNTPGANANAVKELVICGMLLSGRKVVDGVNWVNDEAAKGTADIDKLVEKAKSNFTGPELRGKKLGVIGLGAIGVGVANAAALGLGMTVLGYDPFMSVDAAWHLTRGVRQAFSQDEIISKCDYITLHLPLNDKTTGMINEKTFAKMKKGAVLLNFARGGLVDNAAVKAALADGTLAHYVTDFPNDEIAGTPGVIATPHLGASTPESEENCAEMAAKELAAYITDGNIKNSVNLPDCELPRSEGYRVAIINKNVTNMLGQISAVLAEDKHNIDHMLNKSRGSWAYTLMDITDKPSDACIERIKAIDGVVRVRII